MDALLLLASTVRAVGYSGRGDFFLDKEGRLTRRAERTVAPFAYAGAAILHPRLFADAPDGAVLAQPPVRPRRSRSGGSSACASTGSGSTSRRRPRSRRRRGASPQARPERTMRAPERLHDPAGRAVPRHAGRRAARRPADRRLSRRTIPSRSPTSRSICRRGAPPAPSARVFSTGSAGRCSCRTSARSAISTRTISPPTARCRRASARRRPAMERQLVLTRLVLGWSGALVRAAAELPDEELVVPASPADAARLAADARPPHRPGGRRRREAWSGAVCRACRPTSPATGRSRWSS